MPADHTIAQRSYRVSRAPEVYCITVEELVEVTHCHAIPTNSVDISFERKENSEVNFVDGRINDSPMGITIHAPMAIPMKSMYIGM